MSTATTVKLTSTPATAFTSWVSRKVVVAGYDAALQGEGADDFAVIVVELGDGTGAVGFEGVGLWKVGGVDEEKAGGRSHQRGNQDEQAEEYAAYDLTPRDFDGRKMFVERLHSGRVRIAPGWNALAGNDCKNAGATNKTRALPRAMRGV